MTFFIRCLSERKGLLLFKCGGGHGGVKVDNKQAHMFEVFSKKGRF